MKGLSQSCKR